MENGYPCFGPILSLIWTGADVIGNWWPGNLKGAALDDFIRAAATTYYHQTCTAKMGHDAMSVVDNHLKVYGIDNLRIADGSIMPRVTTGNTMAPCVIIGERAAEITRLSGIIP